MSINLSPDQRSLAASALAGDDDALGRLLASHQRVAYNLAFRLLGREADARDAVQDAFLLATRAVRGGAPPREVDRFGSWLLRIVSNTALGQLRRRPALRPLSADVVAEVLPAPERVEPARVLERREARGDVLRALLALPASQRAALTLREYEGLSYDEIAGALGLSRSAVETLLFRARREFRAAYEGLMDSGRPVGCAELGPLLSAMLDSELDASAWLRVSDHLEHCGRCRGELSLLRRSHRLHAGIPLLAPPVGWQALPAGGGVALSSLASVAPIAPSVLGGVAKLTGLFGAKLAGAVFAAGLGVAVVASPAVSNAEVPRSVDRAAREVVQAVLSSAPPFVLSSPMSSTVRSEAELESGAPVVSSVAAPGSAAATPEEASPAPAAAPGSSGPSDAPEPSFVEATGSGMPSGEPSGPAGVATASAVAEQPVTPATGPSFASLLPLPAEGAPAVTGGDVVPPSPSTPAAPVPSGSTTANGTGQGEPSNQPPGGAVQDIAELARSATVLVDEVLPGELVSELVHEVDGTVSSVLSGAEAVLEPVRGAVGPLGGASAPVRKVTAPVREAVRELAAPVGAGAKPVQEAAQPVQEIVQPVRRAAAPVEATVQEVGEATGLVAPTSDVHAGPAADPPVAVDKPIVEQTVQPVENGVATAVEGGSEAAHGTASATGQAATSTVNGVAGTLLPVSGTEGAGERRAGRRESGAKGSPDKPDDQSGTRSEAKSTAWSSDGGSENKADSEKKAESDDKPALAKKPEPEKKSGSDKKTEPEKKSEPEKKPEPVKEKVQEKKEEVKEKKEGVKEKAKETVTKATKVLKK